ncbi:hypothetical protein [Roseibacillus persicicus]|uniref:hypothetical protein n=1 Tax=Roseibacillus persicicus TaxID=454148 RepID=UPI00167AB315|nr:hypothetical protein [Roseibacillus persicicus]
MAGLALLAWPLSLVTGQASVSSDEVVALESAEGWVTDVSVVAVHEFVWMELRRGDEVLGRIEGPEREGEFECLLEKHGEVLVVAAEFVEGTPETAMKVTLWAGAMPEIVLNIWGEGELLEEVEVKFHE